MVAKPLTCVTPVEICTMLTRPNQISLIKTTEATRAGTQDVIFCCLLVVMVALQAWKNYYSTEQPSLEPTTDTKAVHILQ